MLRLVQALQRGQPLRLALPLVCLPNCRLQRFGQVVRR